MGLREGLRLIRGMRRALTKEEQHKIAGKMFAPPWSSTANTKIMSGISSKCSVK